MRHNFVLNKFIYSQLYLIFYAIMKMLASHLKGFVDYARLKGIDCSEILKEIGITYDDVTNPRVKVSAEAYFRIVKGIGAILNDDKLGLHLGQHLNLSTLGVIYQISMKTRSLMECLYYCHDFLRKTFPSLAIGTSKNGTGYTFSIHVKGTDAMTRRYISESLITMMSREVYYASGGIARTFMYSPFRQSDYPENWRRGEKYAISFSRFNSRVVSMENSGLDSLIPAYLGMIEGFSSNNSFPSRVKISALMLSNPVLPDLTTIASNLNMSPRTFQRQLMKEGSSYREITEELKKKISSLLLRHSGLSIFDISTILGFAEPASYIHSFVKWHGKSPSEVRGKLTSF